MIIPREDLPSVRCKRVYRVAQPEHPLFRHVQSKNGERGWVNETFAWQYLLVMYGADFVRAWVRMHKGGWAYDTQRAD